jgi:hypothetical protein
MTAPRRERLLSRPSPPLTNSRSPLFAAIAVQKIKNYAPVKLSGRGCLPDIRTMLPEDLH